MAGNPEFTQASGYRGSSPSVCVPQRALAAARSGFWRRSRRDSALPSSRLQGYIMLRLISPRPRPPWLWCHRNKLLSFFLFLFFMD